MRWPTLSIRATVLLAIVAGMLLPATVLLWVEGELAQRQQQPVIELQRSALLTLGATAVAQPAWTLSESGLAEAVTGILANPGVCSVQILGLPRESPASLRGGSACNPGQRTTLMETAVRYQGQAVARLRLAFDDTEIDRLVAQRRSVTVWLVVAQVVLGVLVLAGVLGARLLKPIDLLKRQAGQLAAREAAPRVAWPRRDELGQLGEHLNDVQTQIRGLVDELEGKNAQLHQMAMYDPLTGLPNRTLLRELFTREAAAARRHGSQLALMFLDLDQFKAVNDSHGHQVGDELLVHVGAALRETLRESDVVCRMGGDEFLLLLPRVDGWDSVAATAERLLQAVSAPHCVRSTNEPQRVGGSLGIAMYPADGADFDALVRAADLAMYRSKDLGRGRYSFYHVDLDTTLRSRLEIERELGVAIEQDQLVLHYQPVVDGRDGRVIGCEALLRWQHPQRGLLPPSAFVHVAEETGLVNPMGRWVLDAACAQLAVWKAAGLPALRMAVNVSAVQLRDPAFPRQVQAVLGRHGIAAGELTLEITESVLLADGDGVLATVAQLRATGARLALDDFGTGYSSLSYLKKLRPDMLKIDRSFVRDLPGDADDCTLARAIVGMARALTITVLAEGVETESQRSWLLAEGCELQQGFLWARPLPPAEFEALLEARQATGAVSMQGAGDATSA